MQRRRGHVPIIKGNDHLIQLLDRPMCFADEYHDITGPGASNGLLNSSSPVDFNRERRDRRGPEQIAGEFGDGNLTRVVGGDVDVIRVGERNDAEGGTFTRSFHRGCP